MTFPLPVPALPDRSRIKPVLDAARCLRSRSRFSRCEICVQACPFGALRIDSPVALDEQACTRCGLCLQRCPTEALNGEDGALSLLEGASRLTARGLVELACPVHPDVKRGPKASGAVLFTRGCLAAVSPSTLLSLLSLGVSGLVLRLDACSTCPLAAVVPAVRENIERARGLLELWGRQEQISAWDEAAGSERKNLVFYDSQRPPVSRRDLLRFMGSATRGLALGALPFQVPSSPSGTPSLPRERRWLLAALGRFASDSPPDARPLPDSRGLARLSVDERCDACMVCTRVCPTDALEGEQGEESYSLRFSPGACIGCDLCIELCRPGALHRNGTATLADLLRTEPLLLAEGKLQNCQSCGIPFAGESGDGLCALCAHRQNHPLGSLLPPDFSRAPNSPKQ